MTPHKLGGTSHKLTYATDHADGRYTGISKNRGVPIQHDDRTAKNRRGEVVRYRVYRLESTHVE